MNTTRWSGDQYSITITGTKKDPSGAGIISDIFAYGPGSTTGSGGIDFTGDGGGAGKAGSEGDLTRYIIVGTKYTGTLSLGTNTSSIPRAPASAFITPPGQLVTKFVTYDPKVLSDNTDVSLTVGMNTYGLGNYIKLVGKGLAQADSKGTVHDTELSLELGTADLNTSTGEITDYQTTRFYQFSRDLPGGSIWQTIDYNSYANNPNQNLYLPPWSWFPAEDAFWICNTVMTQKLNTPLGHCQTLTCCLSTSPPCP
jgi:hypothetical protein